jgi:hypothetical protein
MYGLPQIRLAGLGDVSLLPSPTAGGREEARQSKTWEGQRELPELSSEDDEGVPQSKSLGVLRRPGDAMLHLWLLSVSARLSRKKRPMIRSQVGEYRDYREGAFGSRIVHVPSRLEVVRTNHATIRVNRIEAYRLLCDEIAELEGSAGITTRLARSISEKLYWAIQRRRSRRHLNAER